MYILEEFLTFLQGVESNTELIDSFCNQFAKLISDCVLFLLHILIDLVSFVSNELIFLTKVNIFETNLFNIIILLGSTLCLIGNALATGLFKRQQKIVSALEISEEVLDHTKDLIDKSFAQLNSSSVIIDSIKDEVTRDVPQVTNFLTDEFLLECYLMFHSSLLQIARRKLQIDDQLADYYIDKSHREAIYKLKTTLKYNPHIKKQVIDKCIDKL